MSDAPGESPTRLRVEHGPRPLGVATTRPRLSWWLPPGVTEQKAYRIETVIDDAAAVTTEVACERSVLCPWPLVPLTSRSSVRWRVQVLTDDGWSRWSSTDSFEVGLIRAADWQASFIGRAGDGRASGPRGLRGATYLRTTFNVPAEPARARIYATALGLYELHLDGDRVGDLELTPGFTAYRSSLEVQTYDVTDRLGPGDHTLVATITDGWYRGSIGIGREEFSFGDKLGLLAQLELVDVAGNRTVLGSDTSWQASGEGPIIAADLIEGEKVDLRVRFPPAHGWAAATLVDVCATVELTASPSPPTRRVEEYPAVSVTRLDSQRQVIDVGANINGWLRIATAALGSADNHVRLTHGERRTDDGDVDMRNLDVVDFVTHAALGHGQVDEIVAAETMSDAFEPHHTTHGFQYVRVEGADDLNPDDVTGVMVHTDLTRTGWFRCSDQRLNALHEAAVLSFRGNACEIPTDCPHRERAGWTGDWQIFAPTAAFLYDVAGFSDRWLRDLAADQWSDGRVTNFVPDPVGPAGENHPIAAYLTGSSGWGDAAVLVPSDMWQAYGDVELLARQYPSMTAWVEFGLAAARNGRHRTRVATRPEPSPHERYLWDAGFHWGEWCEPDGNNMEVFTGEADQGHVATAYLARSLGRLADAAGLLDHADDASRYAALAADVRSAWRAEFVAPDGKVSPRTQANLTRALAFHLVDDVDRPSVATDLVDLIESAGDHVGTGFLTTPFLLPVLADHGHLDLAYRLLLQETPPSWLAMIAAGATTIWENWEGIDADGLGSFNHYSKGAVISFLHRYVAGIRPIDGEPAYRRFQIRPQPGGGLTSAEATLDSPYGRIHSVWALVGDRFTLDVTIPSATRATITLPDGTTEALGPGDHHLACRRD